MRTYYESQGKGPYAIQRVINGHRHVPVAASTPHEATGQS